MNIQVVNDKDELIGVKERTLIDYNRDIYRVSALWVTNLKGQVLLAKRSGSLQNDPGKWGPAVAGTVDANETYEINICKEAKEEIGLDSLKFTKGPKIRITKPRNYFCQWYFANLDKDIKDFTMQQGEVSDLAWVDIKELKHDLKYCSDKFIPTMIRTLIGLGL